MQYKSVFFFFFLLIFILDDLASIASRRCVGSCSQCIAWSVCCFRCYNICFYICSSVRLHIYLGYYNRLLIDPFIIVLQLSPLSIFWELSGPSKYSYSWSLASIALNMYHFSSFALQSTCVLMGKANLFVGSI